MPSSAASFIVLRNAGDDNDHSDAVNLVSTENTPASEINTWSMSKFLPNGTLSTRVHRLLRPFRESALQLSPTDPMNAARAPLISITSHTMLQPSVAMNTPIKMPSQTPRAPGDPEEAAHHQSGHGEAREQHGSVPAQVPAHLLPAEVVPNGSARPGSERVRQGARSHASDVGSG